MAYSTDWLPHELAALLNILVQEEGRLHEQVRHRLSPGVESRLADVYGIARKFEKKLQDRSDIEIPINYSPHFAALTEMYPGRAGSISVEPPYMT
ncbi:MAG: hypothetical protein R3C24_04680 [Cyanobacteriota/Melainabacteria group bacterium]